MQRTFLLFAAVVFLGGCGTGGSSDQKTNYTYVDADAAKASKTGAPMEDPSKVAPANVTKADLAKQQKVVDDASAAFKKAATAANRQLAVVAMNDLAGKTMDCSELTPKEKYPAALRIYREVLKLDPKNPTATDASGTIIAIYKQMGRPVPN